MFQIIQTPVLTQAGLGRAAARPPRPGPCPLTVLGRSVPAARPTATGASTGRHCRKTTSVARTAHARPACAGRRWPGRSCGLPPECSRSFKLQSLGLELTLRPTRNNPSGPPPAPATVTVIRTPTAGQPVPVTQMPIIRDRLRTQPLSDSAAQIPHPNGHWKLRLLSTVGPRPRPVLGT